MSALLALVLSTGQQLSWALDGPLRWSRLEWGFKSEGGRARSGTKHWRLAVPLGSAIVGVLQSRRSVCATASGDWTAAAAI